MAAHPRDSEGCPLSPCPPKTVDEAGDTRLTRRERRLQTRGETPFVLSLFPRVLCAIRASIVPVCLIDVEGCPRIPRCPRQRARGGQRDSRSTTDHEDRAGTRVTDECSRCSIAHQDRFAFGIAHRQTHTPSLGIDRRHPPPQRFLGASDRLKHLATNVAILGLSKSASDPQRLGR